MRNSRSKANVALMVAVGLLMVLPIGTRAQDRIKVVSSLTTYADIARAIGGELAEVVSIADGRENIHHVQPKPSFVLRVKRADMLITTGLDLEMWLPSLLDRANNPAVSSGQPGFVSVSPGVSMLDVPATLSRTEGDSHKFGNHHIWTEPANAVVIARNILAGFKRVDAANAAVYQANHDAWVEQLMRAYVGAELVDLLGLDLVLELDRTGELWDFLGTQEYQGAPLRDRLGGWLAKTAPIRGKEMICYHKQWSYFTRSFGVDCAVYVEPKPGIPPSPKHVAQVIRDVRDMNLPVLLAVNYYDQDQIRMVAERTGAAPVIVPMSVDGEPEADTFIDLVSLWVDRITDAFGSVQTGLVTP